MKTTYNRILITLATVAVAFSALAWKQEDVNEFSRLMKDGQELAKAGKYEEAIAKGKAAMKVNFVRARAADFVTGCYAKLALHGTDKMLPMRWLDECWEKRAEYLLDDASVATLMSDYGWRAYCMFRPDLVREAKRRMDSIGVKPDVYRHFDLAEEGIRLYDDLASFPKEESEIGFGKTLADFGVADTNTVEEVYAKRLAAGKTYDAVKGKANLRRNDAVHRLKQHVELTVNNFLDTRNCCKRARHTNTAEFEAVGTALRGLTEEINRIAATISLADVKYRLERIREAAQNYLDIKNRETIVRASNQRKYRMDWAKRLVTFADNAAKEIGETDKALKVIDDRTAAAKTVHDHLPEDRGEVFYQINEAIEKRTREKEAVKTEKAAEPKPEAKPQPPMLP